jgi:hypothetical protein
VLKTAVSSVVTFQLTPLVATCNSTAVPARIWRLTFTTLQANLCVLRSLRRAVGQWDQGHSKAFGNFSENQQEQ